MHTKTRQVRNKLRERHQFVSCLIRHNFEWQYFSPGVWNISARFTQTPEFFPSNIQNCNTLFVFSPFKTCLLQEESTWAEPTSKDKGWKGWIDGFDGCKLRSQWHPILPRPSCGDSWTGCNSRWPHNNNIIYAYQCNSEHTLGTLWAHYGRTQGTRKDPSEISKINVVLCSYLSSFRYTRWDECSFECQARKYWWSFEACTGATTNSDKGSTFNHIRMIRCSMS